MFFKDTSEISARSFSIQRHPDSLSGAVTHSQTQTEEGRTEKLQLLVFVFVQKRERKRMKQTDNTQKIKNKTNINFCFLKSPTTLDEKALFSHEIGLYSMKP